MYWVNETTCTGCGECVDACPAGAISLVAGLARIDYAICTECGSCAGVCPHGAIAEQLLPAVRAGLDVVESAHLAPRPPVEVLPAALRHNGVWPAIGSALVWTARELLPAVFAAWRTSQSEILRSSGDDSVTFGRMAPRHSRAGRRHRWGRAS
jgi:NAD-dependent dihydropyrimidine dehydrogenase PreA subunit